MPTRPSIVLLVADDYALTEGVSRGIEELAERRLVSGTGAMVTTPHWRAHAPRIARWRDRIAIGLHLNLTLGAPLGPLPRLASKGRLPTIGALTAAALTRRIHAAEIEMETTRQLIAFEDALGFAPDYVDGHQHAHALPGVRNGVLAALSQRGYLHRLLVRDPGPRLAAARGEGTKGLALAALSAGFGRFARNAGFSVNDTFAGVTGFAPEAAASELRRSLSAPGRLHLAMCHPGFPDAELAAIDPVTDRRRSEYDALVSWDGLASRIWHAERTADGAPIDWPQSAGTA